MNKQLIKINYFTNNLAVGVATTMRKWPKLPVLEYAIRLSLYEILTVSERFLN